MGRAPRGMKSQVKNPGKIFARIMKYVLQNYTPHCIVAVVSIFISVLANVQGTLFTKTLIDSYIHADAEQLLIRILPRCAMR